MKNIFKIFGFIAFIAVIIISIVACNKNKEQVTATNQSSTPFVAVEEPSSNDEYDEDGMSTIAPPPDFPGTWKRVGGEWLRTFNSEDYEELLKGNLFNFSGSCANGTGEWKFLNSNGTFGDGQTASGFTRQNNPKQASGGDFYMWGVNSEGGGFAVALFPVGVDVMGYDGIIPTDKTKVRLTMGQDLPSSSNDIFYLP